MLPHSDDIYKIITTVIEEYPEIKLRDDVSTSINGSILWNFIEHNHLNDEHEEILNLLEALNLFSVKREYREKGSNPISGSTFSINNLNWKKMYLYGKYSAMIPSV
jgi:hypothetical protein